MIFAGLLTGYLLFFAAGVGITFLLMRDAARINVIECLALSWIFGPGCVSLLLWIGGRFVSGPVLTVAVTILCLSLAAAGLTVKSRAGARFYIPRILVRSEWLAIAVLAMQVALVFFVSLKHSLGWDGLLVWEIKARYAFLGNHVLPDYYYNSGRGLTHPEYPLCIPLSELWLYIWMGEAHQFWIKTFFPMYYAAAVALLVIAAVRLTGKRWIGYSAAVLFFFVPHETVSGGSVSLGYADFPLSLVYFVSVAYLLFGLKGGEGYAFNIAAATLVLLPWIKREGAILWLIAAVIGLLVFWRKRMLARIAPVVIAPGLSLIIAWNAYLNAVHVDAPREFAPVGLGLFWQNAYRLIPTWYAIFRNMSDVQLWSFFWLLAVVATIYLICRKRSFNSGALLAAAAGPLLAYSSIYVFSTYAEYVLHITISLSRLLMHVVPVAWLIVALAVAIPFQRNESVPTDPR